MQTNAIIFLYGYNGYNRYHLFSCNMVMVFISDMPIILARGLQNARLGSSDLSIGKRVLDSKRETPSEESLSFISGDNNRARSPPLAPILIWFHHPFSHRRGNPGLLGWQAGLPSHPKPGFATKRNACLSLPFSLQVMRIDEGVQERGGGGGGG